MSTLPIPLPCSWSIHTLTLKGVLAVISGLWVNPRHGRGPRDQVAVLTNHGTETLYDSINDMKYFRTVCITPQPCHSHFCC